MNEQLDQRTEHADAWPMPSPDVRRELEPPVLVVTESEWPVSPQARVAA
jgi:hypothetical protein